jgi:PPOX class probable F420-dependent enzyme
MTRLSEPEARFLSEARTAVMATVAPDGRPRLVPICFALASAGASSGMPTGGAIVYSPLDEKPKQSADVRELARVRDLLVLPEVSLLVDRWDEDWTRLGWVMIRAAATLEPPGSASAELLERYPQYRDDPPAGQVISLSPERILWWLWEADRWSPQA